MTTTSERIEIARAAYGELRRFLDDLSPLKWSRASMCRGWEVRDVVAHLVDTSEYQSNMVSLGVRGGLKPSDIFEGVTQEVRTRSIGQQALAQREKLADDLLPSFVDRYKKLFDLFSSLTEEELDKRTFHPIGPGGVVKVRTYIDLAVLETTLHSWDIRYSLDPSATLTPSSVPVLMKYASAWLRRILKLKGVSEAELRYRFNVGDWAEPISDVLIGEDNFSRVKRDDTPPTAILNCDVDTFLLLHFGRFSFGQAMESGRLEVGGDTEAVRLLDTWIRPV